MNPKQGEYFAQRIFEFDHDAAIDYCGPPTEFAPMSVIFSADASFTDEEMIELSSHLSDLEFLDVSRNQICLLYTSPSPRDLSTSRMPSSA